MRSFKRTSNGLNNQHLFYNVDLIVYVEGGTKTFSKSEVYNGAYHSDTEDIIYWSRVFAEFKKGEKIKFKSVGSKTIVKEIAIDVINGSLKSVIVAMDNEFDEILKRRIEHPNVFYTFGYSWENDVWNYEVIKAVIEELSAIKIENTDIESVFSKFLKEIRVAVCADGYLFQKSSSFFPRQSGYLFCVDCAPKYLPSIKKTEISKKLAEKSLKRPTLNNFGRKHSIQSQKHCFGHLLADFCCQVVFHYLKNSHSLTGLKKDFIYRIALNKYFNEYFVKSSIHEFHEKQFLSNDT